MVMMPGNTDILRISGPAADTLRTIVAGQPVDPSAPTVLELANQGIISTSGMSRRGLIRAGAIGAGAGIAVLAMPSVAAAASGGGGGGSTILGSWNHMTRGGDSYDTGTTSEDGATPLTVLFFFVVGVDFPDELGQGTFSERFYLPGVGATPPGPLIGLPAEFNFAPLGDTWRPAEDADPGEITETNADAVRTYSAIDTVNGNNITWAFRVSSVPSSDLTASFLWGGVTYPVTFEQPS